MRIEDILNGNNSTAEAESAPMDMNKNLLDLGDLTSESSITQLLDYIAQILCTRLPDTKFVFKGSYLLSKMMDDVSRVPNDIDIAIGLISDYGTIKELLELLGDSLKANRVIDAYSINPDIDYGSAGGVGFFRGGRKLCGVFVELRELDYGIQEYSIYGHVVKGYDIDRILADKLSMIYSDNRYRKSKDLYDFYILTDKFEFDLGHIITCLRRSGSISWASNPFNMHIFNNYKMDYDRLVIGRSISKPAFESCLERADALACALQGAIKS